MYEPRWFLENPLVTVTNDIYSFYMFPTWLVSLCQNIGTIEIEPSCCHFSICSFLDIFSWINGKKLNKLLPSMNRRLKQDKYLSLWLKFRVFWNARKWVWCLFRTNVFKKVLAYSKTLLFKQSWLLGLRYDCIYKPFKNSICFL